ncbi:hypothetical protein ABPG72_008219 [Tetrahymena utriculariae]
MCYVILYVMAQKYNSILQIYKKYIYDDNDEFDFKNVELKVQNKQQKLLSTEAKLEQEIDKEILEFDILKFQYESIVINENYTHIIILDKEECLSQKKKFKQYIKTILRNLNFQELENLFQITLENQQQNFLISFLKHQKNYLCEFTDQDVQGIMIEDNLQQIIQSFQNYILNSVFNITTQKNENQNSQTSDDVPKKK